MKSREFKKIYHPRTGRYVYKHRGNGIIVDNLMKPLKKVASALTGQVLKPFAKKAIQAGVSQAGERVGKKLARNPTCEGSQKSISLHFKTRFLIASPCGRK